MGSTHGKKGIVYRWRPNGFAGNGLNDLTWGTGYSAGASAYFEVVIDGVGTGTAGVDTFKWRKDGGAWTTTVDITGAAQTLSDSQTVTFGATGDHTADDQWVIGNLKDEACSESGTQAQITAAAKRILNPNAEPTFSDSGAAVFQRMDHATGVGFFDVNVTTVTVTGNNGYIPAAALEKAGYLYQWGLNVSLDLADKTVFQADWKTAIEGLAEGDGSAEGFFVGTAWWKMFEDGVDQTQEYFFVQLFSYDPDNDQTGDHFNCWVTFNNLPVNTTLGEVVKQPISFKLLGRPGFTANV